VGRRRRRIIIIILNKIVAPSPLAGRGLEVGFQYCSVKDFWW
jgi:hypothetical protein